MLAGKENNIFTKSYLTLTIYIHISIDIKECLRAIWPFQCAFDLSKLYIIYPVELQRN